MNAKLIFKMEIYKFLNDKKYLIIAGVLALLNTVLTIQALDSISSYSYYYGNTYYFEGIGSLLGLTYIFTFVFLFVYPFHVLAQDYKNNVLALMMASGVNRTKLYFSKIGAAILCSFGLVIVVALIPSILVGLKMGNLNVIGDIISGISSVFGYLGVNSGLVLINMLISYLVMIVIINAAVIFSKGSSKSVLFYFGFMMALGVFRNVMNPIVNIYQYDINGNLLYGMVMNIVILVFFGWLSLRQMNHQNL
ncbi:MAG: hypothetical protein ACK5LC_07845 [Coprobacillaceae bacterium]